MKNKINIDSINIGVVGAGSWGTAIANHLGLKGFKVDLWVFEEEVKDQIDKYKENKIFLPGFILSSNILPSNDLRPVVSGKDLIIIVVPSHFMREMAHKISGLISKNTIIASASKGIENKTHLTMSGVLQETLPEIPENRIAVISGPSFAKEVANKVPTLVTVASKDKSVAEFLQHVFSTSYFRAYTTDDLIGVELGGSVKNVIAIAAGIIDGLGFGLNTRAALITRGLTEIKRLGLKLGANPNTFAGLAGIGDLILTCTGDLSRNHTVGKKIGEGKNLNEILSEMRMVAEGVKTAKSIYNLSRKIDVEMPICQETYNILYNNVSPKEAARKLMSRELKQEIDE
jgi:glycerol-3-phosphate dehydrogenase (NAD(P)+)